MVGKDNIPKEIVMLKYFYKLYFQYRIDDSLTSTFGIGYFTTLKKAKEMIDVYSVKTGFKDFDKSQFHIDKRGVWFDDDNVNKEEIDIYELSCEKQIDDDVYEWADFGVFSSYDKAEHEKKSQEKKRAYRTAEFFIDKWQPDKDLEWSEGFNSIDG